MGAPLAPGFLRFTDWLPALSGGDHAEAYLEDFRGTSIHIEDSRISEMTSGADRGAGLRYLIRRNGDIETLHGSVDSLDAKRVTELAERLLRRTSRRLPPPRPRPLETHTQSLRRDPLDVPIREKVGLLMRVDRTVRAEFPEIVQVDLAYMERSKRFAVLTSEGVFRLGERTSVAVSIGVTAGRKGLLESSEETIAGLKGFELFNDFHPLTAARRAAANAVAKLSAPLAPPGEFPVVLASSAGGTLIHEAVGHSLEADHVQDGTSPHYSGRLGRRVAPRFVTIVDDPTLPFARGTYPFDDEGSPARPTTLVENGVLKDYLYDRSTAIKAKRSSNGHGRREGFRNRPIPRMSNLYVAPGPHDPGRIVREVGNGLLVTKMGGGEVNTATGEFVFGVDEGFWIDGGRVRHRVRDASILGVGPEVLRSVDRVGWDIGWGVGYCGKRGQGVPVSDGQPTLRIPKLLLGGRERI